MHCLSYRGAFLERLQASALTATSNGPSTPTAVNSPTTNTVVQLTEGQTSSVVLTVLVPPSLAAHFQTTVVQQTASPYLSYHTTGHKSKGLRQ